MSTLHKEGRFNYEGKLKNWRFTNEPVRGNSKPLPTWINDAGYKVVEDPFGSRLYGSSERKWIIIDPEGKKVRSPSDKFCHKPRRFSTAKAAMKKVEKNAVDWELQEHNNTVEREAGEHSREASRARRAKEQLAKIDKEYSLGINEENYAYLDAVAGKADAKAEEIRKRKLF